jgi:hypothetical protein
MDAQAKDYPETWDLVNALSAALSLSIARIGHDCGTAEFGELALRKQIDQWRLKLAESEKDWRTGIKGS